jgi:hypothetical protein
VLASRISRELRKCVTALFEVVELVVAGATRAEKKRVRRRANAIAHVCAGSLRWWARSPQSVDLRSDELERDPHGFVRWPVPSVPIVRIALFRALRANGHTSTLMFQVLDV